MADKNATRQELIIKTAMQLFAVKGSSSTSMQEIAELCGISKGSLYLVFKSKEELERIQQQQEELERKKQELEELTSRKKEKIATFLTRPYREERLAAAVRHAAGLAIGVEPLAGA